jgi:hypothetical protein
MRPLSCSNTLRWPSILTIITTFSKTAIPENACIDWNFSYLGISKSWQTASTRLKAPCRLARYLYSPIFTKTARYSAAAQKNSRLLQTQTVCSEREPIHPFLVILELRINLKDLRLAGLPKNLLPKWPSTCSPMANRT